MQNVLFVYSSTQTLWASSQIQAILAEEIICSFIPYWHQMHIGLHLVYLFALVLTNVFSWDKHTAMIHTAAKALSYTHKVHVYKH